jgi:hypothetical protein
MCTGKIFLSYRDENTVKIIGMGKETKKKEDWEEDKDM